jgi:polyisoprenoid-binding protein YceI
MKHVVFAFFLAIISNAVIGQIYMCKDGITKFTSEAPLEMIKAQSNKTVGALDFSNKNVAFSVVIQSFDGFNSALQKEHFLENYMEADKYPKATFKGKIIEDVSSETNGTYSVRAKGIFNIHGIDKEKIIKVKIVVKDKVIEVDSDFEVPLTDHDIKIPKIVNQKIASVISVQFKASLKPQAK